MCDGCCVWGAGKVLLARGCCGRVFRGPGRELWVSWSSIMRGLRCQAQKLRLNGVGVGEAQRCLTRAWLRRSRSCSRGWFWLDDQQQVELRWADQPLSPLGQMT